MPRARKPPYFIEGARRVRGAGTAIPQDHPYINPDGTFDPQKLLEQLSDAPGAFDLLIIDQLIEDGSLAPEYHEIAE
jgi:hypothetical protein